MITKLTVNSIIIGKIFIENLNKELYARKIESLTDLNIRTIINELKNLMELNILDYKNIGKSKIYFLKNTLDCDIFLELVENYRTFLFICENKLFKINLQELLNEVNFLIFGSFVVGKTDEKSDLDLLIFSKKNKKLKKIIENFPIKTQVQWIENEKKFEFEYKKRNPLIIEILKKHLLFGEIKVVNNLIKNWKKIN